MKEIKDVMVKLKFIPKRECDVENFRIMMKDGSYEEIKGNGVKSYFEWEDESFIIEELKDDIKHMLYDIKNIKGRFETSNEGDFDYDNNFLDDEASKQENHGYEEIMKCMWCEGTGQIWSIQDQCFLKCTDCKGTGNELNDLEIQE